MSKKKSVTLIELVVVVVIVGVVASVSVPNFIKAIERARDREAVVNLRLIQAGERIYSMKTGFWYPPSLGWKYIDSINTNLKLQLPPSISWSIRVRAWGGYSAEATRTGGFYAGRIWRIAPSLPEPSCAVGPCP